MPNINFFFPYKKNILTDRNKLKGFIQQLFKKEKTSLDSLQYIFCSDDFLLQVNKQYLKHDYYTDIITFNLGEKAVEGEIYISIDRVKDNATTYKTSFKRELHRVIFHGALHLCGYKDKLNEEKKVMRAKEDRYLQEYFK
ncbi:rRNA maturation RNase YbeY [Terrimonas sp.]|uniref:rRNA maturation RNase YbeY n=1 Tax=Terrimonas sp. TaxID=1914338 RepID=UPI000D51B264|nr:rRNA maturation RNase YbeY [Terrimonas sp.]PVD51120.1 rRNA maturation RNase YbeY [Terrimonas sp.]